MRLFLEQLAELFKKNRADWFGGVFNYSSSYEERGKLGHSRLSECVTGI